MTMSEILNEYGLAIDTGIVVVIVVLIQIFTLNNDLVT